MYNKVIELIPNNCKGFINSPAYLKLDSAVAAEKDTHIKDFIGLAPDRVKDWQFTFSNGLNIKWGMNRLSDKTMNALIELAKSRNLKAKIAKMFSGAKINNTEGRAALHTALRNVKFENGIFVPKSSVMYEGKDVMPDVCKVLNQMSKFTSEILDGTRRGRTGKKIKHIVSIGIGGSDKGPRMASRALQPYLQEGVQVHYIASPDAAEFEKVVEENGLSTEDTLFIIESKSFTTNETMTNAANAKEWFLNNGGTEKDIEKHFVACSTATEKVKAFGILEENMFPFWDWVGGRVSVTSAIGLPVMMGIGVDNYAEFLEGHSEVDNHFQDAPLEENVPVKLALMDFLYRNFYEWQTRTAAIYSHLGNQFPTYLQQLIEESNGKQVDSEGNPLQTQSSAFIIPAEGPLDQHSFFQNRHQGSWKSPFDFIIVARNPYDRGVQQKTVIQNAMGQISALTMGKVNTEDPQRNFEGNTPANVWIVPELSPKALGMMIAMYENRTYADAYLQGINPSDQFGVELGKEEASKAGPILDGDDSTLGDFNPAMQDVLLTVREAMAEPQ